MTGLFIRITDKTLSSSGKTNISIDNVSNDKATILEKRIASYIEEVIKSKKNELQDIIRGCNFDMIDTMNYLSQED